MLNKIKNWVGAIAILIILAGIGNTESLHMRAASEPNPMTGEVIRIAGVRSSKTIYLTREDYESYRSSGWIMIGAVATLVVLKLTGWKITSLLK